MGASFLTDPHLPQSQVTALAIGKPYPKIAEFLENRGIKVYTAPSIETLDPPIRSHIDLQLASLGEGLFYGVKSRLTEQIHALGATVLYGESPTSPYPLDCRYNFLQLGQRIWVGKKVPSLPPSVLSRKEIFHLAQGYVKCSSLVVSSAGLITGDRGIGESCRSLGIDVLLVENRNITLRGYDTGFIGGCGCLLSPEELCFFGDLSVHPQGKEILSFCRRHHVDCHSLFRGRLQDIGSAVLLLEK